MTLHLDGVQVLGADRALGGTTVQSGPHVPHYIFHGRRGLF